MPMVVESTLDLEFTRTAAVKVKIKSIFVITLATASVIECPWFFRVFFFGCRKCDFPLRHHGLRIAQFSQNMLTT